MVDKGVGVMDEKQASLNVPISSEVEREGGAPKFCKCWSQFFFNNFTKRRSHELELHKSARAAHAGFGEASASSERIRLFVQEKVPSFSRTRKHFFSSSKD